MNVNVSLVEAVKGLLVDGTNRFISATSLVRSVVVDGEGALRAEELRHGGVVLVRDLLAVQGGLNVGHILHNARGGNFRSSLRDGIGIDYKTLVGAILVDLLRSRI